MPNHNHPDLFPNLRAIKLEVFAHTWAKRFPFIKNISLYQKPDDVFDFHVKYVMFFELSEISKTDGYEEYNGQFGELLAGSKALIWLGEARPDDFKEVYKKTPHDHFLDEWRFVTILPEGIVEKYSWILFSRTGKENTIKEKMIEQDKTKVFPCNPETKWDQIEMALLPAGDKFMVKTPLGRGYYDHIDLKFHDKRTKSKRPISLWHFLKQLANMKGFFPLTDVQNFEKLSSNAKRLDKHLKKHFEIKESIYKDRCDKIGGYETDFKISQIPNDDNMDIGKSLMDEELEDPKYSNIKEGSYYPEHSTFKKE
ncbi:MAG: hypothetical protein U9N83_06825 [Thermodesulfobacteriota bacterium]|nr:hypothetical protein [Thermodesulfobacteriota bacterium]